MLPIGEMRFKLGPRSIKARAQKPTWYASVEPAGEYEAIRRRIAGYQRIADNKVKVAAYFDRLNAAGLPAFLPGA